MIGGPAPVDASGALSARLEAFLAAQSGDRQVRVEGLRRLGGGSSREHWAFDLHSAAGPTPRPLLLRRDPPAAVADTDRGGEVALLRALAATDLAAPVVVAADLAGAALERPAVVLERAPGRAERAVLRDRDPLRLGPAGRRDLAVALCDLLADVHRLDVGDPALGAAVGAAPADPARPEIDRWEREARRAAGDEPLPEFAYTAAWLVDHAPTPPERRVVVHGDFRPANVLVVDGRPGTLLDWEFAHCGDPVEDLGWYCAPVYRVEHFLPGVWSVPEFLARYQERTGCAVDPARLHFWQVLAMFKLAAIMVALVTDFLAGRGDRPCGSIDGMLAAMVASARGGSDVAGTG